MPRSILVASPIMLLAACGGTPANQSAPASGPGPSAAQTPSIPIPPPPDINIVTAEARAEIRTGAGAAPYPEGLPPYPGATADQSVNVSGSGAQGGGRILGFRTADPAAQVIAFYADAAGRAGYRVLTRMDAGPSATLVLQREGGAHVSISATRLGNFTQGQIISASPGPGH